ncbi:MAG: dynamin family protein [Hydrococcus sp. C42_A2020_068]|nr:dynamin family protein [Hydrococcus sp. C42_A2020_068]
MMLSKNHQSFQLADSLKLTSQLLDREENSELLLDIQSVCDHLSSPNFRVAVFGSFNHGKSTLLNALLGKKILPTDLIPTTGAAINIKYGTELKTRIIRSDGTEIDEKGTELLQHFTRLNSERIMRSDISCVEVFLPHPLLNNGVELVDLPGTSDREEQDNLVRRQLLSADLIIQVLDANRLFTLTEVDNLQDWLIDKGIEMVIFVVNFLNLLEIEDQKKVMQRARSIAEEFRGNFPNGISNLYRVDALPAFQSKRQGDRATAFSSGILTLESAVQNLVAILSNDLQRYRLLRVVAIANRVKQILEERVRFLCQLNTELQNARKYLEVYCYEKSIFPTD